MTEPALAHARETAGQQRESTDAVPVVAAVLSTPTRTAALAILRAPAVEPRLLLLDEVTSALDPELVGEVPRRSGPRFDPPVLARVIDARRL